MDYMTLVNAINGIDIPCAYRKFRSQPDPPYAIVKFDYSNDMVADGKNYVVIGNYQVQLYVLQKHPPTEELIEGVLANLGLVWRKMEYEHENLLQVSYETQF